MSTTCNTLDTAQTLRLFPKNWSRDLNDQLVCEEMTRAELIKLFSNFFSVLLETLFTVPTSKQF